MRMSRTLERLILIENYFFEIRNSLHDHVYNEQTNEEIFLINKMCRELEEKK
jgi:hypothetical protein